jgi:transposase-like protein
MLRARCDVAAEKSIFQEGHQASGPTTDNHHARWLHSVAPRRARDEGSPLLPSNTTVRSSKYLNNLIQQDHRNIKSWTKVALRYLQHSHLEQHITIY